VDPVVDLDQAWTWANVVSRFTAEAVADVPVTWRSGGDPVAVNTDSDGNSGFAVLPVSTDMQTVQATLFSLYDNTSEHRSATFKPLAGQFRWSDQSGLGRDHRFPASQRQAQYRGVFPGRI
jgi:hypothetical protein